MNNPLVSVITPSYNQGQFIEETILSVKNQTYSNIEHIIVDGGSTDDTIEILKKYEGTYNMKWISEKDEGQYDAINKGFKMARGEILGYINSDDVYLPYTIEKVVNIFIRFPSIDIVYGDWYKIDEYGNLKWRRKLVRPFSIKWLKRYDYINPSATFIKASIVKEENYFINNFLSHCGDYEWFLRLATAGKKFYFIDEVLCYFREHSSSKTFKLTPKEREAQLKLICKLYNISYTSKKMWEDFILAWIGRISLCLFLLKNRKFSEIHEHFVKFIKNLRNKNVIS
jgi:glycosyltransferase involved in cell wall biosynthesis